MTRRSSRTSKVPHGRLSRLAHIGAAATTAATSSLSLRAAKLWGQRVPEGWITPRGARSLARRLSRLRGAAMKLGQMLSIESESLVPPEIAEALSVLRAAADAMPESQVRDVLVRNLGPDWERHFTTFDFEPMAAASIGQVHRATTRTGDDVVLKIQYPGVRASIDSDVDNLAALLKVGRILPGRIAFDDIVQETKRQLHREADYRHEAQNTRHYRQIFGHLPGLEVPAVHDPLCTGEVLTTGYVSGRSLLDAVHDQDQATRNAVAERLLALTSSELLVHRFMQTDPNPANFLYRPEDDTLVLVDFGACDTIRPAVAAGYAEMTTAVIAHDRQRLERSLERLGFLTRDDPRPLREDLIDFVELSSEPLRTRDPYDFGGSDLPERARVAGFDLAFTHRTVRTPPADTLFVQRKLGGVFLLASRMKARVACGPMLEGVLAEPAALG